VTRNQRSCRDFDTADLPTMVRIPDRLARYRKHFLGA
jgi:hypothetical protein